MMALHDERLESARLELDLTVYELWIAHVSFGGSRDAFAVKAYLAGDGDAISGGDVEILEQALDELYCDLGLSCPLQPRAHCCSRSTPDLRAMASTTLPLFAS